MQKIKNVLKMDFMILQKWFHENHMVLNPDKCHYTGIGDYDPIQKIFLNNDQIASSNDEKLIGILLGSKLNFVILMLYLFVKKQAKSLVLLQG